MNVFKNSLVRPIAWFGCFLLMVSAGAAKLAAADTKLEVQLVWGTNEDSSSDPKHKPLEARLAKKLGMFKWKNYFTVEKKEVSVPSRSTQKVRLSPKCEIAIKHLDGENYEINLFGERKHVQKITQKLTKGELLSLAGDDKNDCAWFILIREK